TRPKVIKTADEHSSPLHYFSGADEQSSPLRYFFERLTSKARSYITPQNKMDGYQKPSIYSQLLIVIYFIKSIFLTPE
ncbi:MAG TPA: hypothetical protein PLV22_03930, partial [Candidatus Cloacimonadota bacterium]|nr:hypothetical protein [Candidatus Cloacimonadota bacterium]